MGFKENLKEELKYQGMIVKELAYKSGIPKGTIDHYLAEKSTAPIAENAVKIAQALGVTVEYLVTGKTSIIRGNESSAIEGFNLCKKYFPVIQKLDSMPQNTKHLICRLISEWQND